MVGMIKVAYNTYKAQDLYSSMSKKGGKCCVKDGIQTN